MPDTKIAFWNLQRFNGASDADGTRRSAIAKWLNAMEPDLFAACEIGKDGANAITQDCPYQLIGLYDPSVGAAGGDSQLALAVFKKTSSSTVADRAVPSGRGGSPRGIVSADIGSGGPSSHATLVCLHQTAINDVSNLDVVGDLLATNNRCIVFGDFNWEYVDADARARLAGLNPPLVNVQYLQPLDEGGNPSTGTFRSNRVGPPKLFDYLLASPSIHVVPLQCGPSRLWHPSFFGWGPFNYSDHAPIVYQVSQ